MSSQVHLAKRPFCIAKKEVLGANSTARFFDQPTNLPNHLQLLSKCHPPHWPPMCLCAFLLTATSRKLENNGRLWNLFSHCVHLLRSSILSTTVINWMDCSKKGLFLPPPPSPPPPFLRHHPLFSHHLFFSLSNHPPLPSPLEAPAPYGARVSSGLVSAGRGPHPRHQGSDLADKPLHLMKHTEERFRATYSLTRSVSSFGDSWAKVKKNYENEGDPFCCLFFPPRSPKKMK